MYKVIGKAQTRTFRVLWLLEEIGQSYEHLPVAPASDEAKAYNPLGKIPALVDGTDTLTDSVAIMTYLADKHQALTAPAGTVARAKQDAMTLWLLEEMDALLWANARYTRIYPEKMRRPDIVEVQAKEYARSLQVLEDRLQATPGDFLMGSAFSIPDILAVHCLSWGHVARFPKPPEHVAAYSKRLRARPAYLKAAEL